MADLQANTKRSFNRSQTRPVRETDWSVRFEYDGRDYSVLPPVRVRFGDVAVCRWSPTHTRVENLQYHRKRVASRRADLHAAITMLSQTVEGRRNLQYLKENNYEVVFHTEECRQKKAMGLCDFATKRIVLSEGYGSLARLALVLNHEAAHARLGHEIKPDSTIRFEDQMLVVNVHEAHARASEAKIALELMVGHPTGPKDGQLITPDLLNDLKKRHPGIAKAAVSAASSAGNVHDGQVMADAFIAYFAQAGLRIQYESRHVKWLGDLGMDVLKHKKTHCRKVDTAKLKAALKDGNVPYLVRHRPNVDLSTPRYSGVSKQHIKAFHDAWQRFKRHTPLRFVRSPKIAVYPSVPRPGFVGALKTALARKQRQDKKKTATAACSDVCRPAPKS